MHKVKNYWLRKRAINKVQSEFMKSFLKRSQIDQDTLINDCEFLVADIETTGLSVNKDTLLSIGYVLVSENKVQMNSAQHILVNSKANVGQSATIHGIRDREINAKGEELDKAIEKLLSDLAGKVLVVHYSQLDFGILNKICLDLYGVPLLCPVIDTLAVEYRRYKMCDANNIPGLQLNTCRERYGLPRYQAHNALIDAMATAELWLAQSSYIQGNKQLPLSFFIKHIY